MDFKFEPPPPPPYFFLHNSKRLGVLPMLSLCLVIQRGIRVHPLGFCLGVIVNEKPVNLEKTTSSVLSIIVN